MELLPNKRTVERVIASPNNDGLVKGMEFVLGLLLFVGVGWLIDRAAGTRPLFTLVLFAVGIVGHFARIWYTYDAEMRDEEAKLLEAKRR